MKSEITKMLIFLKATLLLAAAVFASCKVEVTQDESSVVYTVSYELNGGANPVEVPTTFTAASEDITLPTPEKAGYVFGGWYEKSDFSGSKIEKIRKGSTGDKKFYAKWTIDTPPTDVADLKAESGRNEIILSWKNPLDEDFVKVVIAYEGRSVEASKAEGEMKRITGITNGRHTFTVKAYDAGGNASGGVSVYAWKGAGEMLGTPADASQKQKDTVKASYMDGASGNIKIDGNTIEKTSEVIVVPSGQAATVVTTVFS